MRRRGLTGGGGRCSRSDYKGMGNEKTSASLRRLADAILDQARASPVMGVAYPIISITADHLRAIARIREMQEQAQKGDTDTSVQQDL